jgi:hypothetical protein
MRTVPSPSSAARNPNFFKGLAPIFQLVQPMADTRMQQQNPPEAILFLTRKSREELRETPKQCSQAREKLQAARQELKNWRVRRKDL